MFRITETYQMICEISFLKKNLNYTWSVIEIHIFQTTLMDKIGQKLPRTGPFCKGLIVHIVYTYKSCLFCKRGIAP